MGLVISNQWSVVRARLTAFPCKDNAAMDLIIGSGMISNKEKLKRVLTTDY